MYTYEKQSENKSEPAVTQNKSADAQTRGLEDNRPEATAQRKLHQIVKQANQPVQRVIAEDLHRLGQDNVYTMLSNTKRGASLIAKADADGVQIISGTGRARTFHPGGGGRIVVQVQIEGKSEPDILKDVTFELNNAVRQQRFDNIRAGAASGAIPDKDQYARELIRLEMEGMISTGIIGMELSQGGQKMHPSQMYISEYLNFRRAKEQNRELTIAAYINSNLDNVLDRKHELGSHREFYNKQFDEYATPRNAEARRNHQTAKQIALLAYQAVAVAKFTNYLHAVGKLRAETPYAESVQAYVAQHRDQYPYLHLAFVNDPMFRCAEMLEHSTDKEADLAAMSKAEAAKLFAWVERNDNGRFRNIAQLLGLHLGHYDGRPELLTANIYK